MGRRDVSLLRELDTLADAIDAARLLATAMAEEQFGRVEDCRRAPRLIEGTLSVVLARLVQIQRAAGGALDPQWLAAPHNHPLPPSDHPEQQDVVLTEWHGKRRVQMAELELRRAKKAATRKAKR